MSLIRPWSVRLEMRNCRFMLRFGHHERIMQRAFTGVGRGNFMENVQPGGKAYKKVFV